MNNRKKQISYCADCGKELSKYKYTKCRRCNSKGRKGEAFTGKTWVIPKTIVECKCEYCDKSIKKDEYQFNRAKHHFCNKECFYSWRNNLKPEEDWAHKGDINGLTIYKMVRNYYQIAEWRKSVFARDNWTCQHCNQRGGELEAHHIISISEIASQYNLHTWSDIDNCKILADVSNGVTLCLCCHKELHKKLRKAI